MTPKALLSRLNIDPYIAAIVGMVGLASIVPVHGAGAVAGGYATNAAIAVLFFLHGAKLEPRAALAGARHWRLHVVVLLSTFVLFPLLGLTARAAAPPLLPPTLWAGLLLLCVLPSTVQSSIAFTSIARGNVPAALCAATASNLLGMALTPLLAGLLLHTHGGFSPPRWATSRCSCLCRSSPVSWRVPGSARGPRGTGRCWAWWTAARSCWWSTWRSATA